MFLLVDPPPLVHLWGCLCHQGRGGGSPSHARHRVALSVCLDGSVSVWGQGYVGSSLHSHLPLGNPDPMSAPASSWAPVPSGLGFRPGAQGAACPRGLDPGAPEVRPMQAGVWGEPRGSGPGQAPGFPRHPQTQLLQLVAKGAGADGELGRTLSSRP